MVGSCHNLLIDDSDVLQVMDHDEAGILEVAQRVVNDDEGRRTWQSAIRYPNALRNNRKEDTENHSTLVVHLQGLVMLPKILGRKN